MKKNEKPTSIDVVRSHIPALYQVIWVFISLSFMMGILYWRVEKFRSEDKMPVIKALVPSKIAELGGFSGIVEVGLFIDRFETFSMVNNTFVIDGVIWFKFYPGVISLSTLEKFSFDNAEIMYRSPPNTQIIKDQLVARYNIRLKFNSDLTYKDFPVDDHRLDIILANKFVDPSEVIFKSAHNNFNIEADLSEKGWDLVDRNVEAGFIESQLDPLDPKQTISYPAVIFSLDYSRISIRYTLSILLPLALMFYIVLFSITLPLKIAIPSSAGGVTAILAYRFVIENLSPRVGYFMVSDFMFFLFLGISLLVFIINVSESVGKWQLSKLQKMIIIALFQIIVISTLFYLIVY